MFNLSEYNKQRTGKTLQEIYGKKKAEEMLIKARNRSDMKGENNPAKRPEVRKKISDYQKGRPKSEEHRRKLAKYRQDKKWEEIYGIEKTIEMKKHLCKVSHFNIFNKNRTGMSYEQQFGIKKAREMKKKTSKRFKNKLKSEEHKKRIAISKIGKKRPDLTKRNKSKENRKKVSIAHKKLWRDEEFAKKQIQNLRIKPTRPEIIVNQICNLNQLPFNYVGDGKVIINGYNPDFLSKNPKYIIEVNGDYWHSSNGVKLRDKKKKFCYNKLGYKLLTIWEHEIYENPQKVTEKIINFYNV